MPGSQMVVRIVLHFLFAVTVFVAHATEREAAAIEEVVVTAAKREQSADDIPASLSVLAGDVLEERGIADLVDVGKHVPNLNVTTFSAGHVSSANPFIRGIGTQDHLITTDPGVGVYVDGVYLGRQVGQHWNLANVARVEVLRGPQGTLYGRNSIGGAINIITSAPGTDPGIEVAARVGSLGRVDTDLKVDADLTETVAATLSAGVSRRGGVGEFRNLPDVDVGVGETRELSARFTLLWRPAEALSLTLVADANDGDNGLNPYTTLIDEVPGGAVYAAGYRNADVAANPYDNNTGQAHQAGTTNAARGLALTTEWALREGVTVRTIAGARRSEYEAGLDDDSFFADFLSFPERGEADQVSLEVQILGDLAGLELIAGFHRFAEEGANIQDPTVFLGDRGAFRLEQRVDSSAAFVNAAREFDRWRLGGGLRWTEDRKQAVTDVGTGPVEGERSWSETSWDLSLLYAANERMTVYASAQSGYQSGQFPARPYCLFVDPACFAAGDHVTAVNFELGVKGRPWRGLDLRAAAFRTRYHSLPYQVSTTIGRGFTTVNLIVGQRTAGFELDGVLVATERFRVQAALGYAEVQVDHREGVRPVAPLTPTLTLSVAPEYRWPLPAGGAVEARIDWSYRSAMWGEPSSDPGRLTRIASRALVDFHLAYSPPNGGWKVAAYGRNVGDVRYDNARLNTGDYVLRILSNDARESGIRVELRF